MKQSQKSEKKTTKTIKQENRTRDKYKLFNKLLFIYMYTSIDSRDKERFIPNVLTSPKPNLNLLFVIEVSEFASKNKI